MPESLLSYKPSEELRHFTNRVEEMKVFRDHVTRTNGARTVVLSFYGTGGTGKTWLRRRLRDELRLIAPQTPAAVVDFDSRTNGVRYSTEPLDAWLEIRHQLDLPAPQFDLAYGLYLLKTRNIPLSDLTGGEKQKVEWAEQLFSSAFGSLPGAGLITFGAKKIISLLAQKEKEQNPLYKELEVMPHGQIYPHLLPLLCKDIEAALKNDKTATTQCRAVVFLDTFEALGANVNEVNRRDREKWIGELAQNLPHVLVVVTGQNILDWYEEGGFWAETKHLEQHWVGGLSASDSRHFLEWCGITDRALQNAVLNTCSNDPEPGYYPWCLGLCADTLCEKRDARDDNTFPTAAEFQLSRGQLKDVVYRFLRTQDDSRRFWLMRLAVTRSFDKEAAFGARIPSEADWERLLDFSFVSRSEREGWFLLHSHMRRQIIHLMEEESGERLREEHEFWQAHWQSRSQNETDEFAGLAWFHQWHLEPQGAIHQWASLIVRLEAAALMSELSRILRWVVPVRAEPGNARDEMKAAIALQFGRALMRDTLGDRSQNLLQAVACCDEALTFYTFDSFGEDWALAMADKATALSELFDGSNPEVLESALICYQDALRYFKPDIKSRARQWASVQDSIGVTIQQLAETDRGRSYLDAISYHDNAIGVYEQDVDADGWANAMSNKGAAFHKQATHLGFDDANYLKYLNESLDCSQLIINTCPSTVAIGARAQQNKGETLTALADSVSSSLLQEALDCFALSLEFYKRETFPDQWARVNLAQSVTYKRMGNTEASLTHARAALDGFRQIGNSYYIPMLEEAVRIQEQLLQSEPAELQIHLGQLFLSLGFTEDAIAAYEKAAELDADSTVPYQLLGDAYIAAGHTEEAIAAYEKATELDAANSYLYQTIGTIHYNAGRIQEAKLDYEKAIKLGPESAVAYSGLGAVESCLNYHEEAFSAFEKAIQLDSQNPVFYHWLGTEYRHLGHYDAAVETFSQAIKMDATLPYPYVALGKIYRIQGDYEKAASAYQEALCHAERDARAHMGLAVCHRKAGRMTEYESEIAAVRETIEQEPEYPRCCFEAICGNADEAVALLKPYLEARPGHMESARNDPDFEFIRDDPRFRALVGLID